MNMGAFGENFPYVNCHDLNLDWILEQMKEFKNDYGNIDKYIQDAIDKYLSEHPEYNIEDESITSIKFNKNSVPFYNVTDYGILPNTGDIYRELHTLIKEKVSQTGGVIYFPKGVYTISYTVFIPANTIVCGEGTETEIYFNEDDTTFGTALANAGSNVTIRDIKISQKSKGPMGTGAMPGCIGFSNISLTQCQEPAYSHNFNRESMVANLTAENIVFDGQYPIQTESSATGTINNVIYRNLISNGCVSVYCTANSTLNNVQIENIMCDLLRIISAGTCRNMTVENAVINCLYYNSNIRITMKNVYGKGNLKNNTYSAIADSIIDGDILIKDSIFYGIDSSPTMFAVFGGIREWDNVTFIAKTNQRVLQRMNALSDTDNYEIVTDCNIQCDSTASYTLMLGYGKNNKYSGHFQNGLWGDMFYNFNLSGGASSSFYNCLRACYDTLELNLFIVPTTASLPAIYALPAWFNLPVYTLNGSIEIMLINSQTGASAVTWGKIDNGNIVITDVTFASDLGSYDRAMIKQELKLTRPLTPTEIFNNFIG